MFYIASGLENFPVKDFRTADFDIAEAFLNSKRFLFLAILLIIFFYYLLSVLKFISFDKQKLVKICIFSLLITGLVPKKKVSVVTFLATG